MYKKTVLNNGLRILTMPMQSTNAVTVLILVKTGSKYETKDINGISHFLEHMFFKGTKKRPRTLDISETLDSIGGEYNAFTGKEYTGYYAKVDYKHIDLALDVVSDIFLNSKLDAKEIEREKGVIIEEINGYRDTPMRYIHDLYETLLYGDQPAGWEIAGKKEIVSCLKRPQFVKYMKEHYVPSNTIVCLAGRINRSDVLHKVKKYFSKSPKRGFKGKKKVIEKQTKPALLLHYKETDQTHLNLGVRAYHLFSPMKYAVSVLGVILGGNMSSRLFISVRERQGLAYYVRVGVDSTTDTGYLAAQAGTDNNKVDKTIKTILKEFKKISEKKVSSKELKKAKDYIKGRTILNLESSDEVAGFIGEQELLKKQILTPEELFKKIDKVTQNDVIKVARDIFKPNKLNLALIGPFKDEKRFLKLLKL